MSQHTSKFIVVLACLASLVLGTVPALAQNEAGISGTVKDNTGGALPGVMVVATSPALIEQRRTVATDGAGNYSIVSLPAGTYSVSFTLQGFKTVVRGGVVLQGAFVATISAEMAVGDLSETLTVTAASPVVDVVSTRQQTVLPAAQVHILPGSTSVITAMQYVPGVQGNSTSATGAILHGGDGVDSQPHIDGVKSGMQLGARNTFQGGIGLVTDESAISEIVFDTSGQGAEYAQSGIRTNMIPKSGGNKFDTLIFANGTRSNFVSDNISPANYDLGIRFAPTAWSWSVNPSLGGPIKRDKLWFFASLVQNKSKNYILNSFFDPNDPTTPAGLGSDLRSFNDSDSAQQQVRITHQLTPRNKLTYYFVDHQNNFSRALGTGYGLVAGNALFTGDAAPTYLMNVHWTAPVTNRLLFEVVAAYERMDLHFKPQPGQENRASFRDTSTGLQSNTTFLHISDEGHKRQVRASVAYVTGSHSVKAGLSYENNTEYYGWPSPGDIFDVYFFNGAPTAALVTTNGSFKDVRHANCDCGLFAQDAWTRDRLTVYVGGRFDWFHNSFPEGTRPAGYFSPALTVGKTDNVPNWKDWTGRFGAAYDLFGDSKTAVKVSAGQYLANEALGVSAPFDPIATPNVDYRPWADKNGDGTPLNKDGTPQLNEISPGFNPNFGSAVLTNHLDPNTRRQRNREYAAGVERQLGAGWSVSGMWHRRHYYNYRWVDNQSASASDYTLIPFTTPVSAALPNGGGQAVPVYGFKPGFVFSSGNLLTTPAPNDFTTWNGAEVIVRGRLWRKGFVTGSWTGGASETSFCTAALDDPNSLRFCHTTSPWRHSAKLSGGLPLPYDTMISGLFQVFAGPSVTANYVVNRADVGAALVNNTSNQVTVNLIQPNTQFYDPTTDLQLRFSKTFTAGKVKTNAYMNAGNIFNRAAVTSRVQFVGGGGVVSPSYNLPITIQTGRTLSFGLSTSF